MVAGWFFDGVPMLLVLVDVDVGSLLLGEGAAPNPLQLFQSKPSQPNPKYHHKTLLFVKDLSGPQLSSISTPHATLST